MEWSPTFECHVRSDGEHEYRIGHQLIDEFLEFVVGRARPNTVRAYAHELSVFFTVVAKDPLEVSAKDVMSFVTAQRRPKPGAENEVRGLRSLSVVASGYGLAQRRLGTVSVIGPVPMDYGAAIASVRGVARMLSQFVQDVY